MERKVHNTRTEKDVLKRILQVLLIISIISLLIVVIIKYYIIGPTAPDLPGFPVYNTKLLIRGVMRS